MRATILITAGAILLVALAAGGCGTTMMSTASDGMSTNDVATYQQLARSVESAAETYRTKMMGPEVTSRADCQRIHDGYDSQVRPWISRMAQMSSGMDSVMKAHGGAMNADVGCVSEGMMDEVDHHRLVACMSPDVSIDRSEAKRHADMMTSYSGHMHDRAAQMMNGLDGGKWAWDSMMDGCQGWHDGAMMGDGSMMGEH